MSGKAVSDADRTSTQGGRAAVEVAAVEEYDRFWAAAVRTVASGRPGLPAAARRDEAAEVVQEAIGRALAKADQCQPGKSAGAWVMGFVINVLAERSRRAGREARTAAVDPALDVDHLRGRVPNPSIVDREGPLFHVALARLRPAERHLLELLRDEDLTSRELARRLGLPSEGGRPGRPASCRHGRQDRVPPVGGRAGRGGAPMTQRKGDGPPGQGHRDAEAAGDARVRQLDRLCAAYLTALDVDDWSTLADLWRRAEDDPALEHALNEVNECLLLDEAVAAAARGDQRGVLLLARPDVLVEKTQIVTTTATVGGEPRPPSAPPARRGPRRAPDPPDWRSRPRRRRAPPPGRPLRADHPRRRAPPAPLRQRPKRAERPGRTPLLQDWSSSSTRLRRRR